MQEIPSPVISRQSGGAAAAATAPSRSRSSRVSADQQTSPNRHLRVTDLPGFNSESIFKRDGEVSLEKYILPFKNGTTPGATRRAGCPEFDWKYVLRRYPEIGQVFRGLYLVGSGEDPLDLKVALATYVQDLVIATLRTSQTLVPIEVWKMDPRRSLPIINWVRIEDKRWNWQFDLPRIHEDLHQCGKLEGEKDQQSHIHP